MSSTERGGRRSGCRGVTLIETILFIVIVGIAAGAILTVFANTTRASADPLIRKQALAIAESLMEEIRLMPFTYCDPDDAHAATASSAADCASTPEAMGPEAGETRYSAATPFDNVNDYDGFAMGGVTPGGIRDITNTLIAGLNAYGASVTVTPLVLGGIPATDALRITVTVTGPANNVVALDGIRTRHAPNP